MNDMEDAYTWAYEEMEKAQARDRIHRFGEIPGETDAKVYHLYIQESLNRNPKKYHLHNNGIRYALYDNNGATRCEWYTCTHNVYNSFDEPEVNNDE